MSVQVKAVAEDKGTAEALRQIADLLTADSIIVISGDTVTDVNLRVRLWSTICFCDHYLPRTA